MNEHLKLINESIPAWRKWQLSLTEGKKDTKSLIQKYGGKILRTLKPGHYLVKANSNQMWNVGQDDDDILIAAVKDKGSKDQGKKTPNVVGSYTTGLYVVSIPGQKREHEALIRKIDTEGGLKESKGNWKALAQKLLDKKDGTSQTDFGFRAYLKAVVQGQPTGHLVKLDDERGAGAKMARQALIDLGGTEFKEAKQCCRNCGKRCKPDDLQGQNCVKCDAEINRPASIPPKDVREASTPRKGKKIRFKGAGGIVHTATFDRAATERPNIVSGDSGEEMWRVKVHQPEGRDYVRYISPTQVVTEGKAEDIANRIMKNRATNHELKSEFGLSTKEADAINQGIVPNGFGPGGKGFAWVVKKIRKTINESESMSEATGVVDVAQLRRECNEIVRKEALDGQRSPEKEFDNDIMKRLHHKDPDALMSEPGFVKTPQDEKDWEKAKGQARKQNPDNLYALANHIFQQIKGTR